MEVAGVALAVLPLFITATEHFEKVHRHFVRFRKYGSEFKDFQSELKIQRTLFREQCRFLVAQIAGYDEATEMLSDPAHPSWRDQNLNDDFTKYLESSKEACLENITLIQNRLQAIEAEAGELDRSIAQGNKSQPNEYSLWRKGIRKKLKFAFSESVLDRNLDKIRHLNASFRQITDQLSKCHARRVDNVGTTSREQRRDIEKFRLIKKASAHLYDSLATACTVHNEHAAHMSLQPILTESSFSQIRFIMSFSPVNPSPMEEATPFGDKSWFVIESVVKETVNRDDVASNDPLLSMSRSLKRRNSSGSSSACVDPKKIKAVRFAQSETPVLAVSIRTLSSTPRTLKPNLCTFIRDRPQRGQAAATCLGPLDETSDIQHHVYLAPSSPFDNDRQTQSLDRILGSPSGSSHFLPLHEKFRFCKLLTIAMLQFHTTPWLATTWRSQDILVSKLLDSSGDSGDPHLRDLASLYTNVPIKCTKSKPTQNRESERYPFSANSFLFGLGVIMLEIAFEKPLRSMRHSADFDQCLDDRHTDFFTARRLSATDLASTEMGIPFSRIVDKCIFCNFGRGEDLHQPALQASIYRDVVCELSRMETKFRSLQLGV